MSWRKLLWADVKEDIPFFCIAEPTELDDPPYSLRRAHQYVIEDIWADVKVGDDVEVVKTIKDDNLDNGYLTLIVGTREQLENLLDHGALNAGYGKDDYNLIEPYNPITNYILNTPGYTD